MTSTSSVEAKWSITHGHGIRTPSRIPIEFERFQWLTRAVHVQRLGLLRGVRINLLSQRRSDLLLDPCRNGCEESWFLTSDVLQSFVALSCETCDWFKKKMTNYKYWNFQCDQMESDKYNHPLYQARCLTPIFLLIVSPLVLVSLS